MFPVQCFGDNKDYHRRVVTGRSVFCRLNSSIRPPPAAVPHTAYWALSGRRRCASHLYSAVLPSSANLCCSLQLAGPAVAVDAASPWQANAHRKCSARDRLIPIQAPIEAAPGAQLSFPPSQFRQPISVSKRLLSLVRRFLVSAQTSDSPMVTKFTATPLFSVVRGLRSQPFTFRRGSQCTTFTSHFLCGRLC